MTEKSHEALYSGWPHQIYFPLPGLLVPTHYNKAMFTLYRVVKRTSRKVYRIGLLFTPGTLLSKQFLLRNSAASLRCWKWNVPYRIGFWNGPNQVWTLLSEQKLQRNLALVNDLFKSKGSVANCMTDRASVDTGNASEHFLHHNRTLIPVHTVPEQLLKRSKNQSGTVRK